MTVLGAGCAGRAGAVRLSVALWPGMQQSARAVTDVLH